MAELDENDQNWLELAKMKQKFATFLFISGIFVAFYYFVVDELLVFKPSQINLTELRSEEGSETLYEPIPFDSSEISGGIHVPTGMVADTGCAEVVRNCGACHSLDLVKQNRATPDGWKNKIVWMQETQNLWDLGAQEKIIIKYLAKNYGPENTGRRPNLVINQWYKLE